MAGETSRSGQTPEGSWQEAACAASSLSPGESLVAVARVEDLAGDPSFRFTLPPVDEARIGRLVQERDRQARRAAWRLARLCAGAALGIAPEAVQVQRDARGRPHLAEETGLDLNLSHSRHWVAVALVRGGRIGVDVEEQRSLATWHDLTPAFLSPEEDEAWRRLPADHRAAAALSAWCRKEAVLKATGEGLAADARFLRLPPAGAAVIVRDGRTLTVATLAAAALAPDAVLAVAIEGGRLPRLLSPAPGGGLLLGQGAAEAERSGG